MSRRHYVELLFFIADATPAATPFIDTRAVIRRCRASDNDTSSHTTIQYKQRGCCLAVLARHTHTHNTVTSH